MAEEGLNSRLKKIENSLNLIAGDNLKPKKEFKMPFKAKLSKKQEKDNWITILKLNENGHIEFQKEPVVDQTVLVDDVPRLATGEYLFNYKGKPLMILPSWSVEPFSKSENFQSSLKKGSNSIGYSLLLAKMKSGALGKKKLNLSGGMIIGLIVGLIVIGYLLFG